MTVTVLNPSFDASTVFDDGAATFTLARDGAGTGSISADNKLLLTSLNEAGEWGIEWSRILLVFDVSNISSPINSATLTIVRFSASNGVGDFAITLLKDPATASDSAIQNSDHAVANWTGGSHPKITTDVPFSTWGAGGSGDIVPIDFTLNSTGIAFLETQRLAGTTAKLGMLFQPDYDDQEPAFLDDDDTQISFGSVDNITPDNRPVLTVTHTSPVFPPRLPNSGPGFLNDFMPRGVTINFEGTTDIPNGWVLCDGSTVNAVQNIQFSSLFSIIGTKFGGTGIDSFVLPLITDQIIKL